MLGGETAQAGETGTALRAAAQLGLHGGQIAVSSSLAGGTVFRVELPRDPGLSLGDGCPTTVATPGSPVSS